MITETTDPIIALSAEEYKRELVKTTVLHGFMLDWLAFFENDFECDEAQNYPRCKVYVDTVEWMERQGMITPHPYRERMLRRVKERMAEIKI